MCCTCYVVLTPVQSRVGKKKEKGTIHTLRLWARVGGRTGIAKQNTHQPSSTPIDPLTRKRSSLRRAALAPTRKPDVARPWADPCALRARQPALARGSVPALGQAETARLARAHLHVPAVPVDPVGPLAHLCLDVSDVVVPRRKGVWAYGGEGEGEAVVVEKSFL